MNVILSILLCMAMILGGTGELPAQPETATTWTLSNVTLEVGGERVTLAPEARLTLAAGEQRAALHFEIGGERVYLPLSLEVTPEALLFSLSGNGRAFRLSNEDFLAIAELDPGDLRALDAASEFLVRYGALLGTVLGDPASTEAFLAALGETALKTCAGPSRSVEVEIDGQTYPATETELRLNIALLDDLRSCGVPAAEDFLKSLLEILNAASGGNYASFLAFAESGEAGGFAEARVLLTLAEADGLSYIELRLPEDEAQGFEFFGAITRRGDNIMVDLRESIANDGFLSVVESSSQITGSLFRPETGHVDAHCGVYRTVNGDSVEAVSDVTITEDYAFDVNRLCSGTVTLQSEEPLDPGIALSSAGDVPALNLGQMTVSFRQSAGADGGVTTAVEIVETRTERVALSFDLSSSVGPAIDYFDGAEVYEITAGDLESDDVTPLASALVAEANQLSLDAGQLGQEPSVQAMMRMIQGAAAGPSPDAGAQSPDASADGGNTAATSFEEAAAIYAGELPDYTPPEGYVLHYVDASPEEVYLSYAAPGDAPSFVLYAGSDASSGVLFLLEGGNLTPAGETGVEVYYTENGDVDFAYVLPADGEALIISLFPYGSLDDLAAMLAGLH